jgi:hypothetical protein
MRLFQWGRGALKKLPAKAAISREGFEGAVGVEDEVVVKALGKLARFGGAAEDGVADAEGAPKMFGDA